MPQIKEGVTAQVEFPIPRRPHGLVGEKHEIEG